MQIRLWRGSAIPLSCAPLGRILPCLLIAGAALVAPIAASAAGVSVRFDFSSTATTPFPSDRFSRVDFTQNTFRHVQLPKPDCTAQRSDCEDIDVVNTLDGFNTQPRITVPFTGDIDVSSVNSDTVYLISLGDTLGGGGFGRKVGINQIQWDVAAKTLVFETDQLLDEHTRYLLVVTDGVRDASGRRIDAVSYGRFRDAPSRDEQNDHDLMDYRRSLGDGERTASRDRTHIAALSLFTTQSISADLAKIHQQIKSSRPAPIDFRIANGNTARAVFPVATTTAIQWQQQTGTAPSFTTAFVPTTALAVFPGAVGRLAFGRFRSPDYETADKYIPATGTLFGQPRQQGTNDLIVEMFLPSGPRPAAGWPVAIFGHGFTDSMYGAPWAVASSFASKGIATVAISVVGHGFGARSTLNVIPTVGAPVVVPSGGRGYDQDGNGTIDSTEGVNAVAPRSVINSRDGLRQTVVDLMQLVREIQVGVDVDGDGSVDLDRDNIYYSGQSFGGIYGTILLGVEGGIKAGVPNVPGGSIAEVARLGVFRFLTAQALGARVPQLINLPPNSPTYFDENIPLRNLAPVVNDVPGASAIQLVLERNEWVQQTGNPVTYAPFIRKDPLRGNAPKPVIVQFAKGDGTVPNPTATAILRAGDLADRATFFRNDLAYVATGGQIAKNPHTFLTNLSPAAAAPFAIAAQLQIATFFASGGTLIIDPDGGGPIFETPIRLPLPESLNYLP